MAQCPAVSNTFTEPVIKELPFTPKNLFCLFSVEGTEFANNSVKRNLNFLIVLTDTPV